MRNIPFSPPDMTKAEANAAAEAVLSGWITTGPRSKELERRLAEYVNVKRTACVNSATAAMELALRLLGIGPGDEVITCAYTYSASASVIHHVGANIVFVDCLPGSVLIDPEAVGRAITDKTKAIIPIDIGGVPADYAALHRVIEEKKSLFVPGDNDLQQGLRRIAIVADSAHSLGATYKDKAVAKWADFTCYSFHAVKNLTTAEGGAVAFDDVGGVDADELYRRFMLWALHGQDKDALAKTKLGAWEYDILFPGYKCNMTDIMAAIGLAQIDRYDGMLARRREMVARYRERLAGLPVWVMPHEGDDFSGTRHLMITTVDGIDVERRNRIIEYMAERGVSSNVHYKPLPMMTAYKNLGADIADYPNAYGIYRHEITLPLHTLMSDDDIDLVAAMYKQAIEATAP